MLRYAEVRISDKDPKISFLFLQERVEQVAIADAEKDAWIKVKDTDNDTAVYQRTGLGQKWYHGNHQVTERD